MLIMSRSLQHRGSAMVKDKCVEPSSKKTKLLFKSDYLYVKKMHRQGQILHNWKLLYRKKLGSYIVISWINDRPTKKNNKKKLACGDYYVEHIYKINWGFHDTNSNFIYVGNKEECFKLGMSQQYFNLSYRLQPTKDIMNLLSELENPLTTDDKTTQNISDFKTMTKGGVYMDGYNMSILYGHLIKPEHITDYTWFTLLKDEFKKDYFIQLKEALNKINKDYHTIYPPVNELFTSLNLCGFDKVKVVIIGQDPYHNENQAHGLAFSVRENNKIPPSLMNIFKECHSDIGVSIPKHGCLNYWAEQGVLLLNTILTVSKNQPASHKQLGWERFTQCILGLINTLKQHIVFILWGRQAAQMATAIDTEKHHIIISSHPSPLGARKTDMPFITSRCFSRCNAYLTHHQIESINW